jgi:hypothetical protein
LRFLRDATFAEIGGIAVGGDSEGGEVGFFGGRGLGFGDYSQDLVESLVLDYIFCGGLDEGDTVVELATYYWGGVSRSTLVSAGQLLGAFVQTSHGGNSSLRA